MTARALPDNASTDATNARLVTGDATPYQQFAEIKVLDRTAPVRTIALMAGQYWLSFNEEVDVARGIIPGDDTFRTYLTGLDAPRFTNLAMATTGPEPYPVDTRLLGVPAPQGAPTVAAGVGADPTVNSTDAGDTIDNWTRTGNVDLPTVIKEITQSVTEGNPAPSYRFRMLNSPDGDAGMWQDVAITNSTSVTVQADVRVETARADGTFAAAIGGMMGASGEGPMLFLGFPGGLAGGLNITLQQSQSLSPIVRGATLAADTVAGFVVGTWYKLKMTFTRTTFSAATVVGQLLDNAGTTVISEVTATVALVGGSAMLSSSNNGPFALGSSVVEFDNILVQAAGAFDSPVTTATSYVYTFVNDLGEESAPSFASATVLRPDGVAITVTTPTGAPTGTDPDYGITTKRIYRAASGASGTVFLFVAEIPLAQADYVDSIPDTELGEALESEDWDLPPDDLRGILALPNGVMVGFRRNQLCLSAQNRPHAWPVRNRLNTDTDIVGIGNIDTTVVIGTESFPYVASGNDPAAYSMAKFEVPQACVSKRSIAYLTGIGVVFASPDGLIAVSGVGQVRNLTETIFTREQWQALEPESIIGIAHDDVYHFYYGTDTGP